MNVPLVHAPQLFAEVSAAGRVAAKSSIARPACALALMLAAGVHVAVGFEHAGSNFGVLSLAAGAAQGVLGALVLLRRASVTLQMTLLLNLVLVQLYALNVTVGLPPQIGHSHLGGTHEVWLLTLAWPNAVDLQGVIAILCELFAAGCAVALGRRGTDSV